MAAKKNSISLDEMAMEAAAQKIDMQQSFNPLLVALRENDKHNHFHTNVNTAYIKTGFPLFDHYFGSVINKHDSTGKLIGQEPRIGQAAGTFNLLVGASSTGKMEPVSTHIPTPEGWKRFGDLQPGDTVYSEFDRTTKILSVHPQGVKPIYRITFTNGRYADCGLEHLWRIGVIKNETELVYIEVVDTNKIIEYLGYGNPVAIPMYDRDIRYPDEYDKDNLGNVVYIQVQSVEYNRDEEAMCIYVEDHSHLYVTDQMIITHNTTWGAQIAANIIRQFKYSNVIHFDCENRTDPSRIETITRLPASFFYADDKGAERYMLRGGMVGLDVIQEMIARLYSNKKRLSDVLTTSSGITDEFNREVMMLEPTVILIDSITTVLNETFNPENAKEAAEAEKMRGNTEGARDAKTLKGFFKDILPMCKDGNIIVYGINHVNTNMSMNAFIPVAKSQLFLKQDEIIPGGKTMIYYPFNIIKLTAKTGDSFTVESDGFAGHIVMVEPIKSSSNQSGNDSKGISFEMVFSYSRGFDNLRSLIWYGKENGLIEGTKARYKFKDDDSFTFNWKELDKEVNVKPIWESIKKYIIPKLAIHLPFVEPDSNGFDERSLDY